MLSPFSLKMRSARKYPNSVARIPIPAPTMTSLIQWRLLSCRVIPVAVAAAYPPMLYQGLRCPYSLCNMVAVMKAVAVCPEGKEFRAEPSGRFTRQVYLSELTAMAINPVENASETSIRPQELRLWTPQAFSASIAPAGAYWSQSSYS